MKRYERGYKFKSSGEALDYMSRFHYATIKNRHGQGFSLHELASTLRIGEFATDGPYKIYEHKEGVSDAVLMPSTGLGEGMTAGEALDLISESEDLAVAGSDGEVVCFRERKGQFTIGGMVSSAPFKKVE